MEHLTFKLVSGLQEAQAIFEALSPRIRVTDDWLFRYLYYQYFNYPLAFYVAFTGDEPVALLPLQYNTEKGHLEFFGGGYMEDNQIYIKKGFEEAKAELIKRVDQPALLEWMTEDLPGVPNVQIQEYKYEFPLDQIKSIDDYLERFWNTKPRQNLRAQLRKLKEQNLVIEYNIFSDLERMAELNMKRFGNESTFLKPHRIDFFKKLMKHFEIQMISISVNGERVSIGLSVFYKGIYVGMNSGTDANINGLGKLLTIQKMTQALSLGAHLYDARSENLGWKEAFHFIPRPQYMLDLRTER